jgi:hypothetical protein
MYIIMHMNTFNEYDSSAKIPTEFDRHVLPILKVKINVHNCLINKWLAGIGNNCTD